MFSVTECGEFADLATWHSAHRQGFDVGRDYSPRFRNSIGGLVNPLQRLVRSSGELVHPVCPYKTQICPLTLVTFLLTVIPCLSQQFIFIVSCRQQLVKTIRQCQIPRSRPCAGSFRLPGPRSTGTRYSATRLARRCRTLRR